MLSLRRVCQGGKMQTMTVYRLFNCLQKCWKEISDHVTLGIHALTWHRQIDRVQCVISPFKVHPLKPFWRVTFYGPKVIYFPLYFSHISTRNWRNTLKYGQLSYIFFVLTSFQVSLTMEVRGKAGNYLKQTISLGQLEKVGLKTIILSSKPSFNQ